jgi:hypothetical protein
MRVTRTSFEFSKAEARALLSHASPDVDRAHIAGVALDLAAARAFATDGHRAVVAQGRPDSPIADARAALTVPRAEWDRALRMVPPRGVLVARLAPDPGADATALGWPASLVCLEARDVPGDDGRILAGIQAKAPDALPPPILEVMPQVNLDVDRVAWATLNVAYLADLALVARAANPDEKHPPLRIYAPTTALDPVAFEFPSKDDSTHWRAVIMPVRDDTPAVVLAPQARRDDAPNVVRLPEPATAETPKRKRARRAAT